MLCQYSIGLVSSLFISHLPNQLADWNTDQTKRFQALIVQPYVLVQESVTKGA
jgi:hypothetical protein